VSVCVEYFFDCVDPLALLLRELDEILGLALRPDGDRYTCRTLGMELALESPHAYPSSGELRCADYRHVVATRTGGHATSRPIQLAATAMLPVLLHAHLGITRGMLVYDGQILLARYDVERPSDIPLDEINLVRIDELPFPAYLQRLAARLPAPR
jgi:hypothetical protein